MCDEKPFVGDINVHKMGGELSRYLTLKGICEKQQALLREIHYENGVLKSDLAEANHLKEMWRQKYFELKSEEK